MPTVTSGQVVSGGSYTDLTIAPYGRAIGITEPSGLVVVEIEGSISGATVSGGVLEVLDGATATGTTIAGGTLHVISGGYASSSTVASGELLAESNTNHVIVSSGAFYDVAAESDDGTLLPGAFVEVQSRGNLYSATIDSGAFVTVSSGGSVSGPILMQPGAAIVFNNVPYAPGNTVGLNVFNDLLTISSGGTAIAAVQLQGPYNGDVFAIGPAPAGAGGSGTALYVLPGGVNSSPETANTVPLQNGGSVTVTTPGTAFTMGAGPGGVATISVGSGGGSASTAQGSAAVIGPGLFKLQPVGGGSVVPVATGSPLQASLVQAILQVGQTTTSQTIYLPGQGSVPSNRTLGTQVLIDLPEQLDTIRGTAAVPVADIVLDNPGATYITGATGASIVAVADGAPATIINNTATDALIAATGAANNTLEGLAGANQFITAIGGQDAVLLYGAANSLATNGSDGVLVGGQSTIATGSNGVAVVAMTTGTTLAFINQTLQPVADSITGAAGGTIVIAGSGNAVILSNGGGESFIVDTSAGSTTLRGAAGGGDNYLFSKDANIGRGGNYVYNFAGTDTLSLHGYAAFNVQLQPNGALVVLSDGSQVLFIDATVAAIQQAIKVV